MSVLERLRAAGLSLPSPPKPNGLYIPLRQSGPTIHVSGQTCLRDGVLQYEGVVGDDVSVGDAQKAAALCALNILSILACNVDPTLETVRALRMMGFIRCAPNFTAQTAVLNGASEVFISVLGERGYHARSALGTNALPRGAPVEVEATFELV